MTWKKLAICYSHDCIDTCPPGTSGNAYQEKSLDFFIALLRMAEDIPAWEFVLPKFSAEKLYACQSLMEKAIEKKHCFSTVMYYPDLYKVEPIYLQQSFQVTVLLDEKSVAYLEWPDFYQALAWAKQKEIRITVQVNLTEAMLQKVLENLLLPRLLDLAEKIQFHVPKDEQRPRMTRDQFGLFLDYIAFKMLRMRVLKKIDIDACMMPALSLVPRKTFTQCARQNTLTILSNGGVKLCPYGPVIEQLEQVEDFQRIKKTLNKKRYRQLLAHCSWREDWNLQESKATYRIH
ncbi:hypothetical protein K8S19_08650 [bacterium]|nr:hypothetical protein [bacterium]